MDTGIGFGISLITKNYNNVCKIVKLLVIHGSIMLLKHNVAWKIVTFVIINGEISLTS